MFLLYFLFLYRSGTEEDLSEKLTLLQEISDKEEEGKRLARKRKEEQAAAEKARVAQQEKVDACLAAFRAGICHTKQIIVHPLCVQV